MILTVVGCSGSYAGPQSPASSYLVQADDEEGRTTSILLDLGNGALGTLHRHLDPGMVDAAFISHLHPDHCIDLTGMYVVRKYRPEGTTPGALPVYAPAGAQERIELAYHGLEPGGMEGELAFHELEAGTAVTVGPFTVTPVPVNHPVEAYGFRVEAGGKVLAYTGDTDSCDTLTELMHDATLVLSDAAFVDGRDDVEGIHLSGSRAAQAAVDAGGVRRLMLTHIPAWNDPQECRAQAAAVWPGTVELAEPDASYAL